jgi:hypothetical protein
MGPTMLTPEFDEPSFGIKEVLPMAIAAAVAAVVMIYAPQFAPAALSILSKTAAGAAALTAGEIARQASSIALNTQQGIDMEKLGKQAIIGAITGGAAGASQVASQAMLGTTLDKATQGQQIMASMQTAAAVNLSQQLADKSASFSWNQLVCDMLLSAVGTVEARKIPQFDSMLKQYAAEVATVLVNAGLSAAMAKALQNKEISPQAFTIGLASQIAASAPKAWDTVSGNRERIAAQSQKAENIKTPVQQRETKMEAKRQTEQQKAKTNAPVKSVASAKKARSENKGSATKKPVLNGYRNSNRASNNASVSKQEFPHKLAESLDKYTHFDLPKATEQVSLAECRLESLKGTGNTLLETGSAVIQTLVMLGSPIKFGAAIVENVRDGSIFINYANEIREDIDTFGNGRTLDKCRLVGEYGTSAVMAFGGVTKLARVAASVRTGARVGGEIVLSVPTKTKQIASVTRVNSAIPNKPYMTEAAKKAGWKPPFPENTSIREIILGREEKFLRFHTDPNSPFGMFLIREKEVSHILNNPEALRRYLGVENVPSYITEVYVPANTRMYVGRIGPQPKFGLNTNSGFQYQALTDIPKNQFNLTKPINIWGKEKYNHVYRGYK